MPATLKVTLGHSSQQGPRPRNEDFVGAVTPEATELKHKGLLAALADGVGGHANGREAAENTVRSLLIDYYATPDTWSVQHSLNTVILSINRWLVSLSQKSRETAGMATTLSALVVRGSRYYLAHVGDTRIYRLRDGEFIRLTQDHTWDHPELNNVLKRAVGLDAHLSVDYSDGDLQVGDVFMLVCDGVWHTLGDTRMQEILEANTTPEDAACDLAMTAVKRGAQDNCTALVLRIDQIPEIDLRDRLDATSKLPLPPRLKPGQVIDGLEVEEVMHESRITMLYRVRRQSDNQQMVLKTLRQEVGDAESVAALIHEEWLARRASETHFPQVINHPERAHLYYLMSWHEGHTLKEMLERGHKFAVPETVQLGMRLLKGIGSLHRLSVVHRDIKPDNLHLDKHGELHVLDLGVAASDGVDEAGNRFSEINNPGTPSYMAPELFGADGSTQKASESSDLYAAGVTLYELLTRKYPYGEIEPFQRPRFGEPVPPTRFRPDIPAWLEAILLKAVARDPAQRFETAEEFMLALEYGANRPLRNPRRMPLAKREPLLMLKLITAGSLVLNLLLIYLLLVK